MQVIDGVSQINVLDLLPFPTLDDDLSVNFVAADATTGPSQLVFGFEFGYVTGGTFNSIGAFGIGSQSILGNATFAGGTLLDFALHNTDSGQVYSICDPTDYADQIYSPSA